MCHLRQPNAGTKAPKHGSERGYRFSLERGYRFSLGLNLRQPNVGTKAPKHGSSSFKLGTDVSIHRYCWANGCAQRMPVVAQ